MSQRALSQASRSLTRASRSITARPTTAPLVPRIASVSRTAPRAASAAFFSTCSPRRKGIMPETENPKKIEVEQAPETWAPVEITESEYHELADEYLDTVLGRFEELQDKRGDLDVEYSAGVMTITTAEKGTYVLNKQPPNKQIWLSSPLSGPKRYDWCLIGEGQNDKEGTGEGSWVYARDGTSLNQLILEELGVDLETSASA